MSLTPRIDFIQANAVRNVIINGNFDLWQRGAGTVLMTSNDQLFLADRWRTRSLNNASLTTNIARSTDVPNSSATYSLRLEVNTNEATLPAGGIYDIPYRIEGYDIIDLNNRKMLLSFYVKGSVTGTYYIIAQNSGADRRFVASYTIDVANTWEKKQILIDSIDFSDGTWSLDNQTGLTMTWVLGMGSTFTGSPAVGVWENGSFLIPADQTQLNSTVAATFQLSQAMLTAVDDSFDETTDVPFHRAGRTFGEELIFAQRYYEKSLDLDTPPGTAILSGGEANAATQTGSGSVAGTKQHFKILKRALATITTYNVAGDAGQMEWFGVATSNGDGISVISEVVEDGFRITTSSASGGARGDANTFRYHWTADAEL